MQIRPYVPDDRGPCLAIFDSQAQHFSFTERDSFVAFLQQSNDFYFVMEHETEIVGCGGFAMANDGASARLSWGMVRRDLQGQGLGRFLLMFRLREIGKQGNVQTVHVEAPKAAAAFFEKQGFRTQSISADAVELVKKLVVCA